MTDEEKIELLADMFEVETSDIHSETKLDSLIWDSIKRLTFIALVSEHCGKAISGAELREVSTVSDLMSIMKQA